MPYSYPDNIPDYMKNLPADAQKACVSAYNANWESADDETKARMACWGAVKNLYEQIGGEWVRKTKEAIEIEKAKEMGREAAEKLIREDPEEARRLAEMFMANEAKEETVINLDELTTVQKTYAAHNRVHAEYLDARHGPRRKVQMQEDHEAIVRHALDLGGKHLPKGDALDNTLPDDLKEALKLRYLANGLLLGEKAAGEVQILRTGTFRHPVYGKFTITDDTITAMVNNFQVVRPKPPTELVVDYDHLSVDNTDVWQGKAAGWIKGLVQRDGSMFAPVAWTDEARDAIEKQLFRFISPEFTLNYTDKESGKKMGPVLISAALTNRPFLEGMEPVVLNESMSSMLCSEESMYEQEDAIRKAYRVQFGGTFVERYVTDIYEEFVIAQDGEDLFKIPYTRVEDEVTFDIANRVRVKLTKAYEDIAEPNAGAAQNAGADAELPGDQDNEGKEDLEQMTDKELREILKVGDDVDVKQAVQTLMAGKEGDATKLVELQTKVDTAEQDKTATELKLKEGEADTAAQAALNAGKILPAQSEWAKAYALKDPEGFKGYVEIAPKVGPEITVKGTDHEETITLSESEKETGKRLGVTEEKLIAQKKIDQEKVPV